MSKPKNLIDLTPQDFVDAYRKTGLAPVEKTFKIDIQDVVCGCALTALISREEEHENIEGWYVAKTVISMFEDLNGCSDPIDLFIIGFDGCPKEEALECIENLDATEYTERLLSYYELGKSAREIVSQEIGMWMYNENNGRYAFESAPATKQLEEEQT